MSKKQWTKIGNLIAVVMMTVVISGCQTGGAHPFTTMFEKKDPHLEITQAVHQLSVPTTAGAGDIVTAMHEESAEPELDWQIQ